MAKNYYRALKNYQIMVIALRRRNTTYRYYAGVDIRISFLCTRNGERVVGACLNRGGAVGVYVKIIQLSFNNSSICDIRLQKRNLYILLNKIG